MKSDHKPIALVILDGFGYSPLTQGNAIYHARKPTFDFLMATYPHTLLQAAGTAVGLPDGMASNSEVGHQTIGAGKIIKQPITIINEAIAQKTLQDNEILVKNFQHLQKTGGNLHLIGLLSDGGVHSLNQHVYAYLELAKKYGIPTTYIHAILDGRDVPPQSAATYLTELDKKIKEHTYGILGSVHGRFYAMDRDHNWQRTQQSYAVLTQTQEIGFAQWQNLLDFYYQQQIFDEFIPPTQVTSESTIKNNDGILFFNFRPDRARQIIAPFVDPSFNKFPLHPLHLSFFITPVTLISTQYNIQSLFQIPSIHTTLIKQLSDAGKSIFTIAETEKYAHVTYFFKSGREEAYPHETNILIPSLPLRNYTQHPEMSAQQITDAVVNSLNNNPYDFYLINYANADMVGHSGDFKATVKAIECLDAQLAILYEEIVQKRNGLLCITSDHGNAEAKIDPTTGNPQTSHTANPVYWIMAQKGLENRPLPCTMHGLADISPCILAYTNS